MSFCAECGIDHHAGDPGEVEAAADREVEIERLRTKRDIEVARITASAAKDISETEAETGTARAEGQVEGMETVLETISGGGEPDKRRAAGHRRGARPRNPTWSRTRTSRRRQRSRQWDRRKTRSGGWWDGYR